MVCRRFRIEGKAWRLQEGQIRVSLPSSAALKVWPQMQLISPVNYENCLAFSDPEWEMQPSRIASPYSLSASICRLNFFLLSSESPISSSTLSVEKS